jgi:hypothetical protein
MFSYQFLILTHKMCYFTKVKMMFSTIVTLYTVNIKCYTRVPFVLHCRGELGMNVALFNLVVTLNCDAGRERLYLVRDGLL